MITKAILELNACVNALCTLRTSGWIVEKSNYLAICKGRTRFLARDIFSKFACREIRKILNKTTSYTAYVLYSEYELNKFAKDYLEKNDKIIPNKIADDFVEYYRGNLNECRRCSICGRLMQKGYCQDGGWRYYCSDKCLHEDFTDEEWNKECDNNDQSYWTQWY